MQRLVGTTTTACEHRWGSRFSGDSLTKEKQVHQEAWSMWFHLPLSESGGLTAVVHFQQPTSLLSMFATDAGEVPLCVNVMNAMNNVLEPLRLRCTSRCASRGIWLTFGEACLLLYHQEIVLHQEKDFCGRIV